SNQFHDRRVHAVDAVMVEAVVGGVAPDAAGQVHAGDVAAGPPRLGRVLGDTIRGVDGTGSVRRAAAIPGGDVRSLRSPNHAIGERDGCALRDQDEVDRRRNLDGVLIWIGVAWQVQVVRAAAVAVLAGRRRRRRGRVAGEDARRLPEVVQERRHIGERVTVQRDRYRAGVDTAAGAGPSGRELLGAVQVPLLPRYTALHADRATGLVVVIGGRLADRVRLRRVDDDRRVLRIGGMDRRQRRADLVHRRGLGAAGAGRRAEDGVDVPGALGRDRDAPPGGKVALHNAALVGGQGAVVVQHLADGALEAVAGRLRVAVADGKDGRRHGGDAGRAADQLR